LKGHWSTRSGATAPGIRREEAGEDNPVPDCRQDQVAWKPEGHARSARVGHRPFNRGSSEESPQRKPERSRQGDQTESPAPRCPRFEGGDAYRGHDQGGSNPGEQDGLNENVAEVKGESQPPLDYDGNDQRRCDEKDLQRTGPSRHDEDLPRGSPGVRLLRGDHTGRNHGVQRTGLDNKRSIEKVSVWERTDGLSGGDGPEWIRFSR